MIVDRAWTTKQVLANVAIVSDEARRSVGREFQTTPQETASLLHHSITKSTVRRLTIGQRVEKRDATTAQLSPAQFVCAILKVSYIRYFNSFNAKYL